MMLLEVPDLGNVKIGAACGIAPTLRTEREEWGTHFVGRVRMTERPGHPPPTLTCSRIARPGRPRTPTSGTLLDGQDRGYLLATLGYQLLSSCGLHSLKR